MQVWSVTACGRERGRQRERKRVLLCVCVCPRPCVTLLPLMSPFTLQPNLLNTAARTHIRGDAGTRDAASNPLAISPMESNTHTVSPTLLTHPYKLTYFTFFLFCFFQIITLTALPTCQSLFCHHTQTQPPSLSSWHSAY